MGWVSMVWLIIIIIAIAIELFVRYVTRGMEDKKKREKLLSLFWVALGVVLIIYWLLNK